MLHFCVQFRPVRGLAKMPPVQFNTAAVMVITSHSVSTTAATAGYI